MKNYSEESIGSNELVKNCGDNEKEEYYYVTLNESMQGAWHKKNDKPLQDYSLSGVLLNKNSTKIVAYAIVADGHGGEKYFRSDSGSQFACELCKEEIEQNLKEGVFDSITEDTVNDKVFHFCSRLILNWRDAVIKDYNQNGLNAKEKEICNKKKIKYDEMKDEDIPTFYGSTLLAVVHVLNNFWFAIQLGDGKCIGINSESSIFYPIEDSNLEDDDDKFICGVTASLCNKDAIDNFKFSYGFNDILGLSCMTDGVVDSYPKEKLCDFIFKIRENAIKDLEKTKEELKNFLPILSERGSQDDVSISSIFLR